MPEAHKEKVEGGKERLKRLNNLEDYIQPFIW